MATKRKRNHDLLDHVDMNDPEWKYFKSQMLRLNEHDRDLKACDPRNTYGMSYHETTYLSYIIKAMNTIVAVVFKLMIP